MARVPETRATTFPTPAGSPLTGDLPSPELPMAPLRASARHRLIGGGATTSADASLHTRFVVEASRRAEAAGRDRPRIAVISLHPEAAEKAAALGELLTDAGNGAAIDLHLTAGRAGVLEPFMGLGAYALSLPILAVGVVVFAILRVLVDAPWGKVLNPASSFDPADSDGHPIIFYVTKLDGREWLQLFFVVAIDYALTRRLNLDEPLTPPAEN